jgi:hypothetical protein
VYVAINGRNAAPLPKQIGHDEEFTGSSNSNGSQLTLVSDDAIVNVFVSAEVENVPAVLIIEKMFELAIHLSPPEEVS